MICKCGCEEWDYMGNWPNMQHRGFPRKRHDGYRCKKCKAIVKIPEKKLEKAE